MIVRAVKDSIVVFVVAITICRRDGSFYSGRSTAQQFPGTVMDQGARAFRRGAFDQAWRPGKQRPNSMVATGRSSNRAKRWYRRLKRHRPGTITRGAAAPRPGAQPCSSNRRPDVARDRLGRPWPDVSGHAANRRRRLVISIKRSNWRERRIVLPSRPRC